MGNEEEKDYFLPRGVVNMFHFELRTKEMNDLLLEASNTRFRGTSIEFEGVGVGIELNEDLEEGERKKGLQKVIDNDFYEEKLENEFYPFMEEMDETCDQNIVIEILQTHGRFMDTLEFSKLIVNGHFA